MRSWTQHISGAVQLLHLRGKEQLQTRIGHQLFVQLRSQAVSHPKPVKQNPINLTPPGKVINSLQRRVRIPENFVEWSKHALEYETDEEANASTLCGLIMKFCNLRASMNSFHDYRNSSTIVSSALALDAEFADWAIHCPLQYVYNTVTVSERSESIFSDYYHIYSDIWIATTWNHYRSIRILLHEILLVQLLHLCQSSPSPTPSAFFDGDPSLPYEAQIRFSKAVLVQLTQDICASVPFYLDDHNPDRQDGAAKATNPQAHPPRAAGGNLLLWPLFVAACTDVVSDVMRTWVVGRLEKIAEVMGIRQAKVLGYLLSIRKDPPTSHALVQEVDADLW